MTDIPVRLTVTVELTAPADVTIDLQEFRTWMYAYNGVPNAEPTEESLLDFVQFHDSFNPVSDTEGVSSRITAVKIKEQP